MSCKFCELSPDGGCMCGEKVIDELALLSDNEDIHSLINESIHDKWGNNWKYDRCDFCKNEVYNGITMTINGIDYSFCSSKCLVVIMGRVYKRSKKE